MAFWLNCLRHLFAMNIKSILIGSDESLRLLQEVETLYGSNVELQLDPNSKGSLYIKPVLQFPTIFYRGESELTIAACVHELLHLRLIRYGCPFAYPTNPNEANDWLRGMVDMLNNLFQHVIIFPELIRRGFSPYESEEVGLQNQLEALSRSDFSVSNESPIGLLNLLSCLKANMALIYSRAILECQSEALRVRYYALYSQPSFIECRYLGEKVANIVRQFAISDFSVCRVGLLEATDVLSQARSVSITQTNGA